MSFTIILVAGLTYMGLQIIIWFKVCRVTCISAYRTIDACCSVPIRMFRVALVNNKILLKCLILGYQVFLCVVS